MSIRVATDQDWPQIWPIFSQIVAAGQTYAYPEDLSSSQARRLWLEMPPGQTVVAVDGRTVVGSAKMGPNRLGRGAHVSTASFMIDPAAQGRGLGVMSRHVGQSGDRRPAADGGVGTVVIVEVEPAGQGGVALFG